MDEFPEHGIILEALRQPLEDRVVTVAQASQTVTFLQNYADMAANPCPWDSWERRISGANVPLSRSKNTEQSCQGRYWTESISTLRSRD